MTNLFAYLDRQSKIFVGAIVLAGTLLGCLPQISAILHYGNQSWQAVHVLDAAVLGCIMSLLHVLILIIIFRVFGRVPIVSVACIFLALGNIYVSWSDLFRLAYPFGESDVWHDLQIFQYWSIVGFLRMLGVFVVAPVLLYIGLVKLWAVLNGLKIR